MKKCILFTLCIALCAPAWGARATSSKAQTSSSAKKSTGKSTSKKKRRRSTKFVPKQKAPTADRITQIQSALSRGGYYQGDPNGKWDSSTVAAMQKFQSANGLDSNGKIDAISLQKLGLGSDIAGVSAPRPITPGGSSNAAPSAAPHVSAQIPATSAAMSAANPSSSTTAPQ